MRLASGGRRGRPRRLRKAKARPIVALLTDFGQQDHYVGAVKGAVLAAHPQAVVVDVVHDIPVHDVLAGAFALAAAYRAFPSGTVFLAVVDPGVGSARRGLALSAGGYRFVGPDNGLFTLVLQEQPAARIHALAKTALWAAAVAPTFHARDVFAPVAARLAAGLPVSDVGPPVKDPVRLPLEAARRVGPDEWEARVLHVDRFGNLVTTFTEADLRQALAGRGENGELVVVIEGAVLPLARTYADVADGEPCALFGSSGRLEVAVHRGNASRILGASRGAPVRVRRVRASAPWA